MDAIQKIYHQLTNVDIQEQKEIWDERGKGYYGEFHVLKYLYSRIEGNCKILMNLEIPIENEKKTEIDLLMIHETGVYVFEIKHYKGTIYGKETEEKWTQYFRTTQNQVFYNPVKQNEYHMKALRKLFPSMPLYSVVVFTHDDCDLRVVSDNPDAVICKLKHLNRDLHEQFDRHPSGYSMEKIDRIFSLIADYSPMLKEEIGLEDVEEKPFYTYLNALKNEFDIQIQKNKKREKKLRNSLILTIVLSVLATILISAGICFGVARLYEEKENDIEFQIASNEKKVESQAPFFNIQDAVKSVQVSGVNMRYSAVAKGVLFSAKLTIIGDDYGIQLNENTEFLVTTRDGSTYRFDMFESINYDENVNTLGPVETGYRRYGTLAEKPFDGIESPDEIVRVIINNVSFWEARNPNVMISNDEELELYHK